MGKVPASRSAAQRAVEALEQLNGLTMPQMRQLPERARVRLAQRLERSITRPRTGKAERSPHEPCPHPVSRRIGTGCPDCGDPRAHAAKR